MEPEHQPYDEPHLPAPTLWPIGFAIGIVVALVGLIINPTLISPIGGAIAIVFGFLWARDATAELRGEPIVVEPERREMQEAGAGQTAPPADQQGVALPRVDPAGVTRSRFLEGATLGLGGVIGGLITVPVAGFALLPSFLDQKQHKVDLGPISMFEQGQWYITTFVSDPAAGSGLAAHGVHPQQRVDAVRPEDGRSRSRASRSSRTTASTSAARCRRTARPTSTSARRSSTRRRRTARSRWIRSSPPATAARATAASTTPRGTASPARPCARSTATTSRSTTGDLILLSTYSVSHVDGTGATAQIYRYKEAGPGEHIDGPEQLLYPLQPPHH